MLNQMIRLNENVILSEQNDVFTILNPETDDLMVTNSIGKIVLESSGDKVEDIISKLVNTFNSIESQVIEKDVIEFITECKKKGVITIE